MLSSKRKFWSHAGLLTLCLSLLCPFNGCLRGTGELEELRAKEAALVIKPDLEVDAFMRASARSGKRHSIRTDYTLRMLGLDVRKPQQHMFLWYMRCKQRIYSILRYIYIQ